VFDCCHSGSILDLEYFFTGYLADNTLHPPNMPLRRTPRGPKTVKRRILSNHNGALLKPTLLVDNVDSFTLGREFRCDSPMEFLSPVVNLNSGFLGSVQVSPLHFFCLIMLAYSAKAWEKASPLRSKSSSLPRRTDLGPQVVSDGINVVRLVLNLFRPSSLPAVMAKAPLNFMGMEADF
jgi:hypothetical protein